MPRRKPAPTPEQIRRETSRLHAVKGAVLRDMKAIASIKPKGRQKRAHKSAGIRMGG